MTYDYWLDGRGVVHQRRVSTQRLLLRATYVSVLAALAKKVYASAGCQIECLALRPVVGRNIDVGMFVEVLQVVKGYVLRARLPKLKYLMLNGQCLAACADECGELILPVCGALVELAAACVALGRPLHGINWAEVQWAHSAVRAFADTLVTASIPKFQMFTCGEAISVEMRARVREGRHAAEAECRARGTKPWWRDPVYSEWMKTRSKAHKCIQGSGCGKRWPEMGSQKALWWW